MHNQQFPHQTVKFTEPKTYTPMSTARVHAIAATLGMLGAASFVYGFIIIGSVASVLLIDAGIVLMFAAVFTEYWSASTRKLAEERKVHEQTRKESRERLQQRVNAHGQPRFENPSGHVVEEGEQAIIDDLNKLYHEVPAYGSTPADHRD